MRVCLFFLSLCLLLLAPGPSGGAGPAGTLSVLSACGVAHAAQTSRKQPQKRRAKKKKASLHGESWAFGQSAAREDALWKNGGVLANAQKPLTSGEVRTLLEKGEVSKTGLRSAKTHTLYNATLHLAYTQGGKPILRPTFD